MKTHKVIDLISLAEDQGVFCGTMDECLDFKSTQGFGYMIVPMTRYEIEENNKGITINIVVIK